MARYKHYDYGQSKLIPVHFDRQVLPGTFEYTLSYLIEHECDLSWFEARYRNDEGGAPAYGPAILLEVILFAYSRGITSSRAIARACEENVVFMALSADSRPHFTTIASFIANMGEGATQLFRDVLLVCDEQGCVFRRSRSPSPVLSRSVIPVKPMWGMDKTPKKSSLYAGALLVPGAEGQELPAVIKPSCGQVQGAILRESRLRPGRLETAGNGPSSDPGQRSIGEYLTTITLAGVLTPDRRALRSNTARTMWCQVN